MIEGVYSIRDMIGSHTNAASPDGLVWKRAVPMPFTLGICGRAKGALAVLRGEAFAVRWPRLGELEQALDK